jgi:hypothetical protein
MKVRLFLLALLVAIGTQAATHTVRDDAGLRTTLRSLQAGDVLRIAPGTYGSGHHLEGIANLTVEGLDPAQPPRFVGGSTGWHFSRCPGLRLRHLVVAGQTVNGLNLDEGGPEQPAATDVVLENLSVEDIGPEGNHDGIKVSGLTDLIIRDCRITGWGGQGIDLVGCHRVRIEGCRFTGKPGFSASAGIQIKGGSSAVTVENCDFDDAGERPLNVGGSTGLEFFRPPGARHEAKDIVVRGNRIRGSLCAAAFVGVDGAEFSDNSVLHPRRWIFRVLQETRAEGFTPCRNVVVRNNRIVFRRDQVVAEVNVGVGTAPETFRFQGNRWFAEDRPQASRPKLPVAETDGVHGRDPRD